MFKNMQDPLAALPTSHTKKYPLKRQQTWADPGQMADPTLPLGSTDPVPSATNKESEYVPIYLIARPEMDWENYYAYQQIGSVMKCF